MNKIVDVAKSVNLEPEFHGNEAFISEDYLRAEPDRLWRKVWQCAGRVEEIANVGDYMTYDIMDDSIVITRSAADTLSAFYNVCQHRGRKLTEGCGRAKQFRCRYHAWHYDLEGKNIRVLDKEDWKGKLAQEMIDIPTVKVDSWGGWIWVNMDPEAGPLRDYLEPAATMLDGFEFEKMRYRWRQRTEFDCNWKTALEAFMEPYHVEGTHPQLMGFADFYAWSAERGLHGNDGFHVREHDEAGSSGNTITRVGKGRDPRVSTYELQDEIYRTVNASTTQTFVDAARRLVDELPEGTPGDKVMAHFLASAKADDAARGVVWPEISADYQAEAGLAWHLFPNISIQHGITFALVYRVRPHRSDPDKCIFEAYAIERFPEGQEPKTEWVEAHYTQRDLWPPVLLQDFDNMSEVQKGMRSRGFRRAITNPVQERKVINFHHNLAAYMGTGAPKPLA